MTPEQQAILDAMPMPPMPEAYKDWTYRDMPSWLLVDFWDEFLAVMGEGNYKILIMSERKFPNDDRLFRRGQFWISPRGMANLIAHNAKNKS